MYRAPGVIDGETNVNSERARTEVLADAFSDASGEYFTRLKQYEDNIADAEDEIERMKKIGAGAVVAGLLLVFAEITLDITVGLILAGILVALGGGAYAYKQITDAQERIEENEANIEENEPDGEVTFVSQIGVPLYLTPYGDKHMIFDGLDTAPQTTIKLANIDGETLLEEGDTLEELHEIFQKYLDDETTVPPEFAEQLSPGATEHRQLERPLTDQIDRMTAVAEDVDRDTIDVNVHANNTKSASVRKLAQNDLLRSNGHIPLVETRRSRSECEAIVDEIRGVEEEAVSGDLLNQATDQRDRVKEIANTHATRLQENIRTLGEHFGSYGSKTEAAMQKHVCQECLDDRLEDIIDELSLVSEILEDGGSLGRALGDADLDKATDEAFTERIKSDIQERIPEMEEQLKGAYNTLENLGPGGGFCDVHGQVDTVSVADSGPVFGEVWRSLYYEFREPIMNSVEDMEKDAEEVRQNKEQKMIDLTQYEQIKDDVKREFESVKSEYEAAEAVERQLR